MIRRSSAIAAIALILSLALHFLGIGFTFSSVPPRTTGNSDIEVVNVGSTFEEIAEVITEPIQPQEAEVPDPPVEPEPEPVEPTSQAQVASSNPQRVFAPDQGVTPTARPDTSGPVQAETGDTPNPETLTPSGGAQSGQSDARVTPPVEPDATSDAPRGDADSGSQTALPVTDAPTEPPVSQPVPATPAPPAPSVIAALPPEAAPPVPDAVLPIEDLEQNVDENSVESNTASLRPQLRPADLSSLQRGSETAAVGQGEGLRTQPDLIESPLTAYQRDGTNLFGGTQDGTQGGTQTGGSRFSGSMGPGNSDITNYEGRILMHLNRQRPVGVSASGWAQVVFTINPDGSLASVDIIDGSGPSEIDRAAKLQVRQGIPFPLPPGGKRRFLNFFYVIQ